MRELNDPAIASVKLRDKAQISALESEFYLDLIPYWLSLTDLRSSPLSPLSEILKHNHGDFWLYDFVHSPQSPEAGRHLELAIQANVAGNSRDAFQEATLASGLFAQAGNAAGHLRSELEAIYSLRRQGQGGNCQSRFQALRPLLSSRAYLWLESRIIIEASGCLTMVNDFDQAVEMAQKARLEAQHANYASLQLRALGYLGSFDTVEGRVRQSWQKDEEGLDTFWSDVYSEDRGYQFYADLEFAAEQDEQWYLAGALQSEAIAHFLESPRRDYVALAHCRLARIQETIGNSSEAQQEVELSQKLFAGLPAESFSKTDCQVTWASLAVRRGAIQEALKYLAAVDEEVKKAENFTTRLPYEQAWADLERHRNNSAEEKKHLLDAISIGNKGLRELKGYENRFHWWMAMDAVYRRYMELGLEQPHDKNQSLADWESFRSLQMPFGATAAKNQNKKDMAEQALNGIKSLHNSTLIVFAAFPKWTVAWLADDRGIKEFRFPSGAEELARQVREFYDLCSNEFSSLQKVKRAGTRLYELLIAPLEQSLDPRRTVFIDSDQALSLLPWPALVKPDGTYWGQKFTLVNTPGLLHSASHNSNLDAEKSMLIAYPGAVDLDGITYEPLPQAEDEADYVASLYAHKKYLKPQEVTSQNLLEQLPHFSMFHFGGHAETREFSGELIVHGSHSGETFSASKLSGIDLRGMKLAVLSSCSTGRDSNGLVRGFLNAGAGHVIASQWDVQSESTASLMRSFYDSLQTETDGAKALRTAWNRFIATSDHSHPYYWSAFQIFAPVN